MTSATSHTKWGDKTRHYKRTGKNNPGRITEEYNGTAVVDLTKKIQTSINYTDTPDIQTLEYEAKPHPSKIYIPPVDLEANESVKITIKKNSGKEIDYESQPGTNSYGFEYKYTQGLKDSYLEEKQKNELLQQRNGELEQQNKLLKVQMDQKRKERDVMDNIQIQFNYFKYYTKIWIFSAFLISLFVILGLTGILGIFPSVTGVMAAIVGGIGAYINWKEKETNNEDES